MKTNEALEKLESILLRAISGKIDLECRKKLSQGETVKLTVQEQKYTINVEDNEAILKSGHRVLITKDFVPWGKADEDYEAMIKSFDGKGIDPEWFERASENFHSRFE